MNFGSHDVTFGSNEVTFMSGYGIFESLGFFLEFHWRILGSNRGIFGSPSLLGDFHIKFTDFLEPLLCITGILSSIFVGFLGHIDRDVES